MSNHNISINIHSDEQIIIEIKHCAKNQKRRCYGWHGCHDKTLYDWLTLLSSILLPFAIALFTIAITMQENSEQRENRERDLEIAALRRQQDRHIAEQQRNETILSNYLKDISNLILKYGHLLDDHKARITASSMTLTAIQQLNTEKKQFIIRYLYRMTFIDQIETDQPFTLVGADLSNIELSNVRLGTDRSIKQFEGLYLPYVDLTNSSFVNLKIPYSNFVYSDLNGVNFSDTRIQYGYFKSAQLQDSDFRYANITDADFTNANLTGAYISDEQLQEVAFLDYVIFPNGTFFPYERRNYNVLSTENWRHNGTFEKISFNRSMIINQKHKIIISQDIHLEKYAKPYWIDRERIGYILSTVMHGKNITAQVSFFNYNGTLLQTDRLEQYRNNENYLQTSGICRRNTHIIRVQIIITPFQEKEKMFIEYIHLNLTSQYNIHR